MKDSVFSETSPVRPFRHVGVIGAGAWGAALAQALACAGADVTLWARDAEHARAIAESGENARRLPGAPLHRAIAATASEGEAVAAEAFLLVVPAQSCRETALRFAPHWRSGASVLICAKGIEQTTGKLLAEAVGEAAPQVALGVLSGPGFAIDVAAGRPTAVAIASADQALGRRWQATLGSAVFRPYWTADVIGVQLGGALKNVLAIACGIVEGRGLGESARAALIARGFAEMRRLASALGAEPETLMGLSGLGDVVLTCTSSQSRNMSFGIELGRGRAAADILAERSGVVEGLATAEAVGRLAARSGVETPIRDCVAAIAGGDLSVDEAVERLLARPLRGEAENAV